MDDKYIYELHVDSSEDFSWSGKANTQKGDTRPENIVFYSQQSVPKITTA